MAVFEVLERERSKNITGLVQVAFVILGFTVMMLVEFFGKVFSVIIFLTLCLSIYYFIICFSLDFLGLSSINVIVSSLHTRFIRFLNCSKTLNFYDMSQFSSAKNCFTSVQKSCIKLSLFTIYIPVLNIIFFLSQFKNQNTVMEMTILQI